MEWESEAKALSMRHASMAEMESAIEGTTEWMM